jgi:FkbM family methyltransferase
MFSSLESASTNSISVTSGEKSRDTPHRKCQRVPLLIHLISLPGMSIRTRLKRFALTMLPDNVLQLVKKTHYARALRLISEEDEPDLKVIKHLVAPGQLVADLGANIGVYTKYLSHLVGASGRVYSVEPVPLTFEILQSNVKKLGLKNVELSNCAISNTNGHVMMEIPRYDLGGENFYEARVVNGQERSSLRTVKVMSTTIDSLLSALPIRFVKCDVEGHELSCLRGATRTIQDLMPAWLIEIIGDMDDERTTAHQTLCLLRASGYQSFWFDGTKLRLRRPGDRCVNYYFLAAHHLRVLKAQRFPIQS